MGFSIENSQSLGDPSTGSFGSNQFRFQTDSQTWDGGFGFRSYSNSLESTLNLNASVDAEILMPIDELDRNESGSAFAVPNVFIGTPRNTVGNFLGLKSRKYSAELPNIENDIDSVLSSISSLDFLQSNWQTGLADWQHTLNKLENDGWISADHWQYHDDIEWMQTPGLLTKQLTQLPEYIQTPGGIPSPY